MNEVGLFTWIQNTRFYHDLHAIAVSSLPAASGNQLWIDVGCGPGLVARLAAARGYQAVGIDINPGMVDAARRIAKRAGSSAVYRIGGFEGVPNGGASVISATSLLAVLRDPMAGLYSLWQGIELGGTLLIVEPTAAMTVGRVRELLRNELRGQGNVGLYLWASARQGHTVDPSLYTRLQAAKLRYIPLLHGLVGAWIINKAE